MRRWSFTAGFTSTIFAVTLLCAVHVKDAYAATFPADASWIAVRQGGVALGDPATDGQVNGREIIGDAQNPAIYLYADGTDFFVRLRLNATPLSSPTNLAPFGWGLLIDTNADYKQYEFALMISGKNNEENIQYWKNTVSTNTGDPTDTAETLLRSYPHNFAPGGNIRVLEAPSMFGGDADYFLDFSIPLVDLYGPGNANFSPSTSLTLWGGASSSANNIQTDLGGTASAPGPETLPATASDPVRLDGGAVDTDGDGVADSMDADTDNDGVPDSVEKGTSGVLDTDGDGVPNYRDLDSDGDGLFDLWEAGGKALDSNGDGRIDTPADGNGNGLAKVLDPTEGGTPLTLVDTDGDMRANVVDADDDGDSILTKDEIADGLRTQVASDDVDGDGLKNWLDTDSDGDKIPDATEGRSDADSDGRPDYLDAGTVGMGSSSSGGASSSSGGSSGGASSGGASSGGASSGTLGSSDAASFSDGSLEGGGCNAAPTPGSGFGAWLLAGLAGLVTAVRKRR